MTSPTSAPLPRAEARDRRTAAQRTPQTPVTVRARVHGTEHVVRTHVGTGGWAQDADNAVARALDVPATDVTVLAVQGGHTPDHA